MINDILFQAVNDIEVQLNKHPDTYTPYYDRIIKLKEEMQRLRKTLDKHLGVWEQHHDPVKFVTKN